jgi:hypothetical protein
MNNDHHPRLPVLGWFAHRGLFRGEVLMSVTPDNVTARVRAIQRQGIAQIPDAANDRMQRGGVLTSAQEAAADEAIRLACDQLRPGKVKSEKAVEVTIIRVRDMGL